MTALRESTSRDGDVLEEAASRNELLAAFIAADLEDYLWANIGANLHVPRAGALLAHLTHAPNMRIILGLTRTNLCDEPVIGRFGTTDWRGGRWAESHHVHSATYNNNRHRTHGVFFIGGMQVDQHANTNLIGIGPELRRPSVRGPGGLGTGYMASYAKKYYIFATSHSPRVFVPECDYVSAFGWQRGNLTREDLGVTGGGPRYVITPLCIFDFDSDRRMRLKCVHPGVTVDEVIANTGFEVVVPKQVPETPTPSAEILDLLRTRVDPGGALREAAQRL